jgi:hypothetical protein
MTTRLEDEFNLPPIEDIEFNYHDEEEEDDDEPTLTLEEVQTEIALHKNEMALAERVDAALPLVQGLDDIEREMDEYATKAMQTFEELCDLGKNVEDRHAAPVFDSASKMLAAAIQVKQAKIDKKLKMVELQMRKQRLDMQEKELELKIRKANENNDEYQPAIEGKIVGDRSSMIADIMAKMKENDENDK